MKESNAALRAEMKESIDALRSEMRAGLARVDVRFERLETAWTRCRPTSIPATVNAPHHCRISTLESAAKD
jgi:hypothetical protein